jgi:hypothetical protein
MEFQSKEINATFWSFFKHRFIFILEVEFMLLFPVMAFHNNQGHNVNCEVREGNPRRKHR